MCMKRDEECNLREMYNSWVIDLVLDLVDIEESFENPMNEQWNYPYNLLPSSDDDEPIRELVNDHDVEITNEDEFESEITTIDSIDLTNEVNQNTVEEVSGQLSEGQEFEVDVPLVLLSMSRISNNLLDRAAASRN